jgi:hypothetical protein
LSDVACMALIGEVEMEPCAGFRLYLIFKA